MQQFRLEQAIRAYQEGHVDLHGAAERARLPVAILLDEMAQRKVAVIDRPESSGPGIAALLHVGEQLDEALPETSVARATHVMVLDKTRLSEKIGTLSHARLNEILDAILWVLDRQPQRLG